MNRGEATPNNSVPSTPSRPPSKKSSAPFDLHVNSVVLGDRIIKPWYSSLYREELMGTGTIERLFVCERCFKYTQEAVKHVTHMRRCEDEEYSPGQTVYEKDRYSIQEVDGEEYRMFAQNLSLFSKFFIETKSVCYDATTFLYYILLDHGSDGCDEIPHIVGFFSKEKLSWDNNNLACILVFPPWQRQGLGQLLMGASYELSKREGRLGGPERPLSVPGAQSYLIYWSRAVAQVILSRPLNKPLTIREITDETSMIPEDVVSTLLHIGVLGAKRKDGSIKVDKVEMRRWLSQHNIDLTPPVDTECFVGIKEVSERADEDEMEE